MIRILGTIFAGLLGLAFGSFLNVCLSRWPAGESVVKPRSHCRQCGRTLAWWENVPLVSWLALRGRCRGCKSWIGWRYPLVEFSVAVLWAYSAWHSVSMVLDPHMAMDFYCGLANVVGDMLFYWLLIALAVLDAENFWLPDGITLPGIALGFVFVVLNPALQSLTPPSYHRSSMALAAILDLLAIVLAAGLILLIRWLYWLVRRREGIGLGDAKLMALLAAWLGLPGVLLAFGTGVVLGALVAIVMLTVPSARRGAESWSASKLPLGAFLCIGGVVSSLWGETILAAYLRWAGL
jgi:leader peptidase (prepilin peptidase)/N-methyltransferase